MKTKALVVLALSVGLVAAAYAAPAAPAKTGTTVGEFAVRIATALGTEEPNASKAADALRSRGVDLSADLSATLTNVPASGWTDGFTFFSFDTFRAPGFGGFFGLENDFITAAIFTVPATAGDVFHFTNAGAGSYPFAPFTFPPSLVLGLTGLQVDGMVTLFGATGQVVGQSNVSRVLIQ